MKTLVVATLAAAAVAQPAEAAQRRAAGCAKADTQTVRSSEQVRVYRELQDQGNDVTLDRLVACWRPTGRRMVVGSAYSSSGYDQTYANVRLKGPLVALSARRASDACKYGCSDPSSAASGSVEVVDVRRRRRIRTVPVPFPGLVSDLVFTSGGNVAWIAGDRLLVADGAGTRILDSGVASRPLDAEGSIVSWIGGGADRFARVFDGPPVREIRKPRPRRSCEKKGSLTLAREPGARMFTAPAASEGDIVERLYGCLYADGRKQVLAERSDDDYVTSSGFDDVTLAGRYVAWHSTATDASCKADCPPGYNPRRDGVEVYDLRRRRTVRSAVAVGYVPRSLVLTQRGGLAWLSRATPGPEQLNVADRNGVRVLDTGGIRARSMSAEVSIIAWERDAIEWFARLGPAR